MRVDTTEVIKKHANMELKVGELKDMFRALEEMNMKLVESEKSKTRFLSLIRNEFDNPLVSMVGLLKQLYSMNSGEKTENFEIIELVYKDALKLNFQLSNIVAAAAVETGMLEKNISIFNINSMLKDIDQSLNYLSNIASIKIKQILKCPDEIYHDRDKIYTILINLMSNAYNYSLKDGEVEIEIFEDDNKLVISVQNRGSEIREKHSIFDAFYQQEQGFSRTRQGLGIGLSITKAYVDFLGGKIFTTRDNDINIFVVQLPYYHNACESFFGGELDSFMFE